MNRMRASDSRTASPVCTQVGDWLARARGGRRVLPRWGRPSTGAQRRAGSRTYWRSAVGVVLLAGCGPSGDVDRWVVAQLGDESLTVADFKTRAPKLAKSEERDLRSQSQETRNRLLDVLVAQRLLIVEALAQGLEGEPRIAEEVRQTEQQLLMNKLYDQLAAEIPEVQEEEVRRYFLDRGYDEAIGTSQVICTTREQAREALAALRSGLEFGAVVQRYANDRALRRFGPKGGVPAQLKGRLPGELRSAVESLQVGQICPEPVPGPWGFHVVKVTDRRQVEFDSVKVQIAEELRLHKRGERMAAANDTLRQRYDLRLNVAGLRKLLTVPAGQLEFAGEDLALFTWRGGQVTMADYLTEVDKGQAKHPAGQDSAGLYRRGENLAGQRIMVAEARRLGLDRDAEVRGQVENKRDELMAQWLFRREAVNQAQVTEADMRAYYEAHRDRHRGKEGKAMDFESVRDGIGVLLRTNAQNQAMDRFIESLRVKYKDRVEVFPEVLEQAFAQPTPD